MTGQPVYLLTSDYCGSPIRRMDAALDPTKKPVLETEKMLDEARITEQRAVLCDASRQTGRAGA